VRPKITSHAAREWCAGTQTHQSLDCTSVIGHLIDRDEATGLPTERCRASRPRDRRQRMGSLLPGTARRVPMVRWLCLQHDGMDEGRRLQWTIWQSWTPQQRLAVARMSASVLELRKAGLALRHGTRDPVRLQELPVAELISQAARR
jgi:hypothetical protein